MIYLPSLFPLHFVTHSFLTIHKLFALFAQIEGAQQKQVDENALQNGGQNAQSSSCVKNAL